MLLAIGLSALTVSLMTNVFPSVLQELGVAEADIQKVCKDPACRIIDILPVLLLFDQVGFDLSDESTTDNPGNPALVVHAGPDITVDEGTLVNLVGYAHDPDGHELTFSWTQVTGPPMSLLNSCSASCSFIAPEVGADLLLTFELMVSNGIATGSDTVEVTVHNTLEFEDARTIGYWQNHEEHLREVLASGSIDLGDTTVTTVDGAIDILSNGNAKDARQALRAQILATILNLINGSDPFVTGEDIQPVVASAVNFLETHPMQITGAHPARQEALSMKDILDAYNNSGEG